MAAGMDAGVAVVQFFRLAYRERVEPGGVEELARLLSCLGTPERVVAAGLATKTYALVMNSVDLALREKVIASEFSRSAGLMELNAALRRAVLTRWIPQQHRLAGMKDDIRGIARDSGLRFAFLRGAALAARFYTNPQSRVCEDLDVLIPEEERGQWEDALVAKGYRFREPEPLREARRNYMGQTELVRVCDGMLLDLNCRLTGNAGVGPLSQDMGQVWTRAHAAEGGEFLLSPEDLLFETMRHFGHGHDFTRGFWRMCLDVSVLLRKHPGMDIDYIARQAEACEALVMLDLAGHAYNTLYALPDQGDPLFPSFQSLSGVCRREASAFSRAVIVPHLRFEISPPRGAGRILQENRKALGIAWGLNRVRRYWRLVRVLVLPNEDEWLLLTKDAFGPAQQEDLPLTRRYGVFWLRSLAVAPGVVLGGVIRHTLAPLRRWSRTRPH